MRFCSTTRATVEANKRSMAVQSRRSRTLGKRLDSVATLPTIVNQTLPSA